MLGGVKENTTVGNETGMGQILGQEEHATGSANCKIIGTTKLN